MITKQRIQRHLSLFKIEAKKQILNSRYKEGIQYLELFAKLSYHYNLTYTDDEAEELISQISKNIFGEEKIKNKKNRIVFYDSFANEKILAQQYLRAIFSWNCELLYITSEKISPDLLSELNTYAKTKIISYNKTDIKDYKRVIKEIVDFEPEKALLHFIPWDISGFCIWNSIKNVDRFLINLTDHAFWLGKNCADYILEFRRYGAFLSINDRRISIDKLLLQPYYPIVNHKTFQGFPFKKNTIVAFAGSSLYKISGRNNKFLNLIKDVLLQNKNLIFALAGSGNKTLTTKFINENKLSERVFLIGDRKDISAVFEEIDIYVNTFPMIGGLMSQYAAIYHKPIIGYTSPDLYSYNDVEDLLQIEQKGLLVKKNEKDFLDYFHQLVESKECRDENKQFTKGCIISPEEFSQNLYQNLYNYKYRIENQYISKVKLDSHVIADLYIDMENSYHKKHYVIIGSILKLKIFFWFPYEGCKYVIIGLLKRIKKFIQIYSNRLFK